MNRVCVVTGSRADYGLLRWIMQGLQDSDHCRLQALVTSRQPSPELGSNGRAISVDNGANEWTVETLSGSGSIVWGLNSMGFATMGSADTLLTIMPDLLVIHVYGHEAVAADRAEHEAGIPMVHPPSDEVTGGGSGSGLRAALWTFIYCLPSYAQDPLADLLPAKNLEARPPNTAASVCPGTAESTAA